MWLKSWHCVCASQGPSCSPPFRFAAFWSFLKTFSIMILMMSPGPQIDDFCKKSNILSVQTRKKRAIDFSLFLFRQKLNEFVILHAIYATRTFFGHLKIYRKSRSQVLERRAFLAKDARSEKPNSDQQLRDIAVVRSIA
jgi:hypothetical protein